MPSSQLRGEVGNIIEKAKNRIWMTVSAIDDCGIKFITQLRVRGVNVKLLVSQRVSWDVIQRLPVDVRLVKDVLLRESVHIIDDGAFTGDLELTCKSLSGSVLRLKPIPLDRGLELFQSIWERSSTVYTSEFKHLRLSWREILYFTMWYLGIKLEPVASRVANILREYAFKLRIKLIKLMRGSSYPFTLLEPEIQELLRKRGLVETTPIQILTIPKILSGENVLVIAPTGSGKTESVALPVLSLLAREKKEKGKRRETLRGVKVLYIAPMRALSKNVTERLRGYAREVFGIVYGDPVREWHSDVDWKVRKGICETPPLILVTTPESLESILDLHCSSILRNVRYVIVDEIHELIGSKRGEQVLALIERIKSLFGISRIQRMYLSATIPKPSEIARLLEGSDGHVRVVEDPSVRELSVELRFAIDAERMLAQELSEALGQSRGYIVFVNSRAMAELLHHQLTTHGVGDIAVYHSSLSKAQRRRLEEAFNRGVLRGLVATRALELGVDISGVDSVAIIGSPRLPEYLIQRLGRSSHQPGRTSSGSLIAIDEVDLLEMLALVNLASRRRLAGVTTNMPSRDVIAREVLAEALRADRINGHVELGYLVDVFRKAFPSKGVEIKSMVEETVNHLVGKDMLAANDSVLRLGRGFKSIWPSKDRGKFVTFIPPKSEVKVVDSNGSAIGVIDAVNLLFLRSGRNIRLGGRVWSVKRVGKWKIVVDMASTDEFSIPVWKGGGVMSPQFIAIEAYRLLGRLRDVIGDGGQVELGNVRVRIHQNAGDALEKLADTTSKPLPSPRLMIVDMLTAKALRVKPSKLRKQKVLPHDIVATVILYPLGGLIANTIASTLWTEVMKGNVIYSIPKPLGLLIVHKPNFNVIEWLLDLNEDRIVEAASKSPYVYLAAAEMARSLGYRRIPGKLAEEKLLYEEALKQALNRFYDVGGTLRLVSWLKAGCIKIVERKVLEAEGVHDLTRIVFGDILGYT
jgi:ATP-dependent Lhr-like helicase